MFQVMMTLLMIVSIYFVGNGISEWLSTIIIIPGNLIGMGILYLLLSLKIVTLDFIKTAGDFLLKHMSLFFIPFGVSILLYFDLIKDQLLQITLIVVVSTVGTMLITAKVVDWLVKRRSL